MQEEQMIMGKDYIITNMISNRFRYKGCLKERITNDLYKFENVEFHYNEKHIQNITTMTFSSAKYTFKLDNIDDDDTDDDYIMDGIYYKKKMKKLYYRRKSIRIKKKSLKKKSSRRK
jgi:hypothetical protein